MSGNSFLQLCSDFSLLSWIKHLSRGGEQRCWKRVRICSAEGNGAERLFCASRRSLIFPDVFFFSLGYITGVLLLFVHLPWAARWHRLKQHRRSCQPLAVDSGGCVRTSCRGRGSGKRRSSKVIKLLFYCSSSFSLSVQTAQYELALPQDRTFHAKCISKCFAKINCSARALSRERETGGQKSSF